MANAINTETELERGRFGLAELASPSSVVMMLPAGCRQLRAGSPRSRNCSRHGRGYSERKFVLASCQDQQAGSLCSPDKMESKSKRNLMIAPLLHACFGPLSGADETLRLAPDAGQITVAKLAERFFGQLT